MGWHYFQPTESVAQKKARAEKLIAKLSKQGKKLQPVRITGNSIARTFWGKAWCDNLEYYCDFDNRLPRGRSYLRHGAVIHLEVRDGQIQAMVSGSSLYAIKVSLQPVKADQWKRIKSLCSGQISSMIELLQGKFSDSVMQIVTNREYGLFPKLNEIKIGCSCPDYAGMCKHIAAVLYAIGNRLDEEPQLLFRLRGIDHAELITEALPGPADFGAKDAEGAIAADDLSAIFGVEIDVTDEPRAASKLKQTVPKRGKPETTKAASQVETSMPKTRNASKAARKSAQTAVSKSKPASKPTSKVSGTATTKNRTATAAIAPKASKSLTEPPSKSPATALGAAARKSKGTSTVHSAKSRKQVQSIKPDGKTVAAGKTPGSKPARARSRVST